MKNFEHYHTAERRRTREERQLKRREDIALAVIFFIIVALWVCSIVAFLVRKDSAQEAEVEEASVQYCQSSVRGDCIPAKGFSSIEDIDFVIPYEHSAVFKVTHYCGCPKCCGKWSSGSESEAVGARGTHLQPFSSVAVDTSIIPLGTILHDAKGTLYIAEDTGSGVKGYHVDLFTGNHQEAVNLGVAQMQLFW